jgi:hypothetical protein
MNWNCKFSHGTANTGGGGGGGGTLNVLAQQVAQVALAS